MGHSKAILAMGILWHFLASDSARAQQTQNIPKADFSKVIVDGCVKQFQSAWAATLLEYPGSSSDEVSSRIKSKASFYDIAEGDVTSGLYEACSRPSYSPKDLMGFYDKYLGTKVWDADPKKMKEINDRNQAKRALLGYLQKGECQVDVKEFLERLKKYEVEHRGETLHNSNHSGLDEITHFAAHVGSIHGVEVGLHKLSHNLASKGLLGAGLTATLAKGIGTVHMIDLSFSFFQGIGLIGANSCTTFFSTQLYDGPKGFKPVVHEFFAEMAFYEVWNDQFQDKMRKLGVTHLAALKGALENPSLRVSYCEKYGLDGYFENSDSSAKCIQAAFKSSAFKISGAPYKTMLEKKSVDYESKHLYAPSSTGVQPPILKSGK